MADPRLLKMIRTETEERLKALAEIDEELEERKQAVEALDAAVVQGGEKIADALRRIQRLETRFDRMSTSVLTLKRGQKKRAR